MKKSILTLAFAAVFALTLVACGGSSSSGSAASAASASASAASASATASSVSAASTSGTSTSASSSAASATATPAASAAASGSSQAATEKVNPGSRSDELFKARIDAQANMLQVLSDWEVGSIETAAGGSQADLDEAYQGALAQLAAKRDEGLAAIDATDDPDAVKQYWKQEVVEEHDVYLKSMQSSYENAKAFLK